MSLTYVLDKNGQPLMPTQRCGKVYRLLKSGKAKVVQREPFTIKLLYEPETHIVQDLTLGVDTGSSKIGTAVVDNDANVYYASKVTIRNDISNKMSRRRIYRRARRTRKLRYRPVRFSNRKNSTKKDRFSPTMVSKINSHIREIEFVKSILPVKTLVIETGTFDPHLLEHIEDGIAFNKHWGYQKGSNYGFANSREACLNRDNYTCQCCGAKNTRLEVHHIIYRSKGGSDELVNLITLCEKCHKLLHDGKLKEFESKLSGKRKGILKHATQMNSIRIQLLRHYPEAIETFGFMTKENRQSSDLEKSHVNDAIIISTGCITKPKYKTEVYYKKKCIPRGDYAVTLYAGQGKKNKLGKTTKPRNTRPVYGFRKHDKVEYCNTICFLKSLRFAGNGPLMDIDGNILKFRERYGKADTTSVKNLKRISARKNCLCTKVTFLCTS